MNQGSSSGTFLEEWKALRTGHWLTDLANGAAFIAENFADLNWAGFYLTDGETLRLGPFQGKVACTEIPFSKGVCGAAARSGRPILVEDVHLFEGHITCDPASRSELVIPFGYGKVWGVLDMDSPKIARFTEADRQIAEKFCSLLIENWRECPWNFNSAR
jgi:L-methionine (R)-S-oxide reductase